MEKHFAFNCSVSAFESVLSGGWGSTWQNALYLCGAQISGSTLGIVGLGRVGLAVAKRLKPFGINRLIYSGNTRKDSAQEVNAEFVPLDALLKEADFVIVCCSVNTQNKGLFNMDAFRKMKKTAMFINMSRGAVVNQDDLYDALTSGEIAAAGCDVTTPEPLPPDHPLLKLPNCVISPHIGTATFVARSAMVNLAARNILAGLKGEPLPAPAPIA
jgi:glyoxylate/hydroxypyruvate reductase